MYSIDNSFFTDPTLAWLWSDMCLIQFGCEEGFFIILYRKVIMPSLLESTKNIWRDYYRFVKTSSIEGSGAAHLSEWHVYDLGNHRILHSLHHVS